MSGPRYGGIFVHLGSHSPNTAVEAFLESFGTHVLEDPSVEHEDWEAVIATEGPLLFLTAQPWYPADFMGEHWPEDEQFLFWNDFGRGIAAAVAQATGRPVVSLAYDSSSVFFVGVVLVNPDGSEAGSTYVDDSTAVPPEVHAAAEEDFDSNPVSRHLHRLVYGPAEAHLGLAGGALGDDEVWDVYDQVPLFTDADATLRRFSLSGG